MKLDLLHLSMTLRTQSDIFERPGPVPMREEWLRRIFGESIIFVHRSVEFHFVPESSTESEFICGNIGRELLSAENEPPEAGLQRTRRKIWQASAVVIDPRKHEEGQRVAMEWRPQVGAARAVFNSLCDSINTRTAPEPYFIAAELISDPEDFWSFIENNRSEVTSVTFEFIAPNMFSIKDDLEQGLLDMREHEHAQKVTLELQNPDGLEINPERATPAVKYATEGGGSIRARTKRGKRFNSKNKGRSYVVREEPGDKPSKIPLAVRLRRAIQAVFKHD